MTDWIPHDNTQTFAQIFPNCEGFIQGWKSSGLYDKSIITDKNAKTVYFLLYSRFGNSSITNLDENQFKYKIYATIFQYAPTWARRLEIQKSLRDLKEEDLLKGSKAIYNTALNPAGKPSTGDLDEIQTINSQNTTNHKRSVLEAYQMLIDLLEVDVTKEFIERFKPFFATFIYTNPDFYVTREDD